MVSEVQNCVLCEACNLVSGEAGYELLVVLTCPLVYFGDANEVVFVQLDGHGVSKA